MEPLTSSQHIWAPWPAELLCCVWFPLPSGHMEWDTLSTQAPAEQPMEGVSCWQSDTRTLNAFYNLHFPPCQVLLLLHPPARLSPHGSWQSTCPARCDESWQEHEATGPLGSKEKVAGPGQTTHMTRAGQCLQPPPRPPGIYRRTFASSSCEFNMNRGFAVRAQKSLIITRTQTMSPPTPSGQVGAVLEHHRLCRVSKAQHEPWWRRPDQGF